MSTSCSKFTPLDPARWVGDPVDVITGSQFDVALDFRIAWPFPFEWRRFYNSARVTQYLPLGWGHTHSYDYRLKFDINGLLFTDPAGAGHGFAYPDGDAQASVSATGALRRIDPQTYRVKVKGHPECEFHFTDLARPAQLRKVFLGRSFHELRYAPDGLWSELLYKAERPVRIDCDDSGRIHALVWRGIDHRSDRLLWEGQYDAQGNLVEVRDAYQTTQSFAYDAAHRMTQQVDRRGYALEASYDATGRCVRSAGEDGAQEVRLRYLPAANMTTVTRADGGGWQYFYQEERIAQIIDPYGGATRRTYGADGGLKQEIGPMDEILREVADEDSGVLRPPFGPPAGRCLPLGDPWFERVRDLHRPADALGWEGYGTSMCRNAIRFPAKQSSKLNPVPSAVLKGVRFASNAAEAGATEEAALPSQTNPYPKKPVGVPERPGVMRLDEFGRLVSHTAPTGETCRWQYDPNGNVIRYVDYAGSEWRYDYASWNLRVRETDPLGYVATYTFNPLEKPIRITDGGGTSTEHDFDLKDRLIERRRHAERRDLFGYDRSDGLIYAATQEETKIRVSLTLGPQRRPVEVAPAGQPVRQCAYDDQGRLIAVTEEHGDALAFAYASLGDCTADLRNGRGATRSYEGFRLAECAVLERFKTQYARDAKDGRTTIVDPLGGVHVIQHLDSGIFLRQHANGVEELAQFDWNGQCLAKIRFRRGETHKSWSRVYRYSPVGALLRSQDSVRGASTYEYDAAHRLIGAASPDGSQNNFSYDGAGNILTAPGLQGVSHGENRLLSANGRQFEYNPRRHIVREFGGGPERRYEYDAEDRLSSCRIGETRITFKYDALGRRITKTAPDGITEFIWDGERLAAEISPDGSLRVYVYADGTAPTPFAFIDYDSIDADPAAGRRRYIFSDQIACPISVEDDSGEILWRAEIQAYGRAALQPNSKIALNLRWPGHYFDSETGLHYNRHRYYSPELGRYIQVDPRDLDGGLNVYAYTARPLDQVDVDGLAPCPKKPMVTPEEGDQQFQDARQRADQISDDLRAALRAAVDNDEMHPLSAANTVLTTMVVQRQDGSYEVVVTANVNPAGLPPSVRDAMGGARTVAYGDDRPPNVLAQHDDWRYPRTAQDGSHEDTTHTHAEQRGLRATDCDPDTKGVAYVAPTIPCCEGCSNAIQTPPSDGGWGGGPSNVSDRGRDSEWW